MCKHVVACRSGVAHHGDWRAAFQRHIHIVAGSNSSQLGLGAVCQIATKGGVPFLVKQLVRMSDPKRQKQGVTANRD